jgi:hydroxymethylpyrimidine/phosphomethylpyrimidine kinase
MEAPVRATKTDRRQGAKFALRQAMAPTTPPTPVALTIAGSDSSGGAGIQADLKTFAALGVFGASAITALTAQNTVGVTGVHVVPPDFLRAQIDAVFADLDVGAVKIGMVAQRASVEAIADGLTPWPQVPVVLDPVMVATSGARLLEADAVEGLRVRLIPKAAIITPNLPEAAALLDEPVAASAAAIEAQGRRLLALGCPAVLIKGGHADGSESVDYLISGGGTVALPAPRVATQNTHGTGCSLSSAIAAGLARGETLEDAVRNAKAWISAAIAAADRFTVGHGHGPIHHFHRFY